LKHTETIDISTRAYKAAVFDLDGVVTDTARLHARAWKRMFDAYLADRGRRRSENYRSFDDQADYQQHVDGKPRYDGVADFLASRDIDLPRGDPEDPPSRETVCGLGNRKNQIFQELLNAGDLETYPASIALIRRLRGGGLKTAVVSSSKNCRKVLEAAGIAELFDERVDGMDIEKKDMDGKPAPDIFLEALRRLSAAPDESLVVEDALAGVAAGRKGGFGCVIGVDRVGQAEALRQSGADAVVADLADVSVDGEWVCGEPASKLLPNALVHIDRVLKPLKNRTPLLFLDYDGTLTPIVSRPENALLSENARRLLRDLAREIPIAVISGRDRKDVKDKVRLDGIYYAGSHGFDIEGPGENKVAHQAGAAYLQAIDQAEAELQARLKDIKGVLLERKKFSIAVHYREVAEAQLQAVQAAVAAVQQDMPDLKKTAGKKVFEIQPKVDWHKGRAVRWLMEHVFNDMPQDTLPVYIGDDVTDEDAFREIRHDGIGIRVDHTTAGESAARYGLKSPEEVFQFLKELLNAVQEQRTRRDWRLIYRGFDPRQEKLREALCTLGNGYFCTRGAAPESSADDTHYPGTYLAGGYNRLKTEIAGHIIENEDLVNMPNWLSLSFRIKGGAWFSLAAVEVLEYRQELDIRHAVLHRRIRFKDEQDHVTCLTEKRLVSMADVHLAALETVITPENWSGTLEFRTAVDGRVVNDGVARYRGLNNRHLMPLETGEPEPDTLFLKVETNQSGIRVALAARTRVFKNERRLFVKRRTITQQGYAASLFEVAAEKKIPIRIEKIVSLYNSYDAAISECGTAAKDAVQRADPFDILLSAHRRVWHYLWRRFELDLTVQESEHTPGRVGMVIHLYIFHVLQTTSFNTMSMALDVGAPARGWHGEAYRGHIFWDELFVFPMINMRLPEITKSLLMYRYRRLDAARRAAQRAGLQGAMYPWQSGSSGREESQTLHLNPRSGRWIPDRSHRQRHVNAAIAYNLYQYYQISRDTEFISFYGTEMMLEIARFWASLSQYNPRLERYEILGVMGPDEYHDGYPGAEEGGLNNNAYTNVMAVWVLKRAQELLDILPRDISDVLRDKLDLTDQELKHWQDISRRMRLVFHGDGIISQFEGYDRLKEFDWQGYREKYGDIQRLDRILEAENDSPNHYKVSKQADVLMLFYLLSAEELQEIFEDLGYMFEHDTIPKNIDYYMQRSSHGSTLSRVVHAWVMSRSDRLKSWRLFDEALESDVSDIQGGTTPEGIHLGAMAGIVDQLQRGYTGIVARENVLWFNPCLPPEIACLKFKIRYRCRLLEVKIDGATLTVSGPPSQEKAVSIGFEKEIYELMPGETLHFELAGE